MADPHSLGLHRVRTERQALELDLRKAIANGEFTLNHQPIVNIKTGKVSACEALIRWRQPELALALFNCSFDALDVTLRKFPCRPPPHPRVTITLNLHCLYDAIVARSLTTPFILLAIATIKTRRLAQSNNSVRALQEKTAD